MVNGNRVAAQDISEYEERNHPAWRSACEGYLKVVHLIVQMERCPELTWRSRTPGRGQPQTFLVDIRASGNFGLTVPTSELRDYRLTPAMKRPNPPAQPKPPRSPKDILNELTRLDTLGLRYLDVTPHIQDQEDFEYTATPTIEPAPSISLRCGLWRH